MTIATAGVAETRMHEPVTPETRFALGSLTKSMVATVFARLDALPIDERAFLVDASDYDIPTVTFDSFDAGVLYHMVWGYPRV